MARLQTKERQRQHTQDPAFSYVLTDVWEADPECGACDRGVCSRHLPPHRHCVAVDARGRGYTSPGPDGHVHLVDELDLSPVEDGHTHELSAQRCGAGHAGRRCLAR